MEEEDGTKENRTHEISLYSMFTIEKEVEVQTKSDCIIDYLCVKEEFEGLRYAIKMLSTAFKDQDIAKKRVHCVTELPYPFKV